MGGELLTLFDSYSYDGVSAGIWVIHTGPKSGGELLTLFDSYSYDSVSAGIWVIHTGPKSGTCMYDPYTSTHTIIRVTAKKRPLLTPRFGTCMYDPYTSTHTITINITININ